MEGAADQQKIDAARAKLRERMGEARTAAKGVPRRKKRTAAKPSTGDDKKVGFALKRLGVTNIQGIEEVTMLMSTGTTLKFANPKVQAAPNANTYVLTGPAEEHYDPSELLKGQLNHTNLPADVLQRLADSLQSRCADGKVSAEDDDVPEVANFEEVAELES
eukprot:Polyplicarium_translucidae@DN2962_c0_g1_i1.p4